MLSTHGGWWKRDIGQFTQKMTLLQTTSLTKVSNKRGSFILHFVFALLRHRTILLPPHCEPLPKLCIPQPFTSDKNYRCGVTENKFFCTSRNNYFYWRVRPNSVKKCRNCSPFKNFAFWIPMVELQARIQISCQLRRTWVLRHLMMLFVCQWFFFGTFLCARPYVNKKNLLFGRSAISHKKVQ